MLRKTRIPLLALVLLLVASTLAITGAAVAGTPTTEIFKIGDFEPGSSSTVGMSEFKQTGWEETASYTCDGCTAGQFPAGLISVFNDVNSVAPHDERGVVTLHLDFDLDYDFIDLTLSLAKFGVESDSVVVVDTAYTFTAAGAGEGIWNRVDLEIPFLEAGSHRITITLAATPAGNGAHVWDALMLTGDQVPVGQITSPYDGEILLVDDVLTLAAWYDDDDPNGVQWAVREGTCAAGTNTVAGNVDGFTGSNETPYTFEETVYPRSVFSSSIDTGDWALGDYCFIFNPRETGNEPNMRLTQWFRIADGHINGGGQIIHDDPESKKPFKVSFGGELWQFGSTVECDWTVQFHNVSLDDYDKGTFHGSTCTAPQRYSDVGADGITNFEVSGELDGVAGFKVIMRLEDFTEPGSQDTIRFELWDGGTRVYDTSDKFGPGGDFPSVSTLHGTARTELDRGNLQMDLR